MSECRSFEIWCMCQTMYKGLIYAIFHESNSITYILNDVLHPCFSKAVGFTNINTQLIFCDIFREICILMKQLCHACSASLLYWNDSNRAKSNSLMFSHQYPYRKGSRVEVLEGIGVQDNNQKITKTLFLVKTASLPRLSSPYNPIND